MMATTFVPFDELGSFSPLFRDYAVRFERLAAFYARDWRSAADRRMAAEQAADRPRDRETLVTVLREQQALWGTDERANAQLERLLDPSSAAVVTGQQVGLFTGPLYTVLKAMTTVRLARHLEAETGRPVVPVFWLGSEDHDLAEMATVSFPTMGGDGDLVYDGHRPPARGNLGSVGALEFTQAIEPLIVRTEGLLSGTEFGAPVMAALRSAYSPGVSFRDAFARLLRALLPESGLVLLSADDVRLKRLALPLWQRNVTESSALHRALDHAADRLRESWHVQVRTAPTDLFVEHRGSRLPVDRAGDGFVFRGTDVVLGESDLVRMLKEETHRFTPNVVLRPLTQDWLLPTAAYVGGPGEVAYFAQFRPAYEWAGLPMPVIHPRATVTIVEPRVERFMARLRLGVPAFEGDANTLFTRLVFDELDMELGTDLDGKFDEARASLERVVGSLTEIVLGLDPGLEKTVGAARAGVDREIRALKERVLRAQRRRRTDLRDQVEVAARSLFPGGSPQERVYCALWYAARFGPGFLPELMERMDVFAPAHQVMHVTA